MDPQSRPGKEDWQASDLVEALGDNNHSVSAAE